MPGTQGGYPIKIKLLIKELVDPIRPPPGTAFTWTRGHGGGD
jgi:hypothetical protein